MATIDHLSQGSQRVLVTGGTGYLAGWVIHLLLDAGHTVHTTVRNLGDRGRYAHLLTHARAATHLHVFSANLEEPNDFSLPMQGCEVVFHVASPFAIEGIADPQQQLVNPAVNGTRNVLEIANRTASVRRIILTSSLAAIYGDAADARWPGYTFTEADWNETSSLRHLAYAYSKTLAEREAWRIAERQRRWRLVALNPGFMLGPALSPHTPGVSQTIMRRFADGSFKNGMVDTWYGFVDVRDVANAHLKAAFEQGSAGRYIVSAECASLLRVAALLRAEFGDRYPLPHREAPKALLWLFPKVFGFTRRYVRRNIGVPLRLSNQRSKEELAMVYRPLHETVREHFVQVAAALREVRSAA